MLGTKRAAVYWLNTFRSLVHTVGLASPDQDVCIAQGHTWTAILNLHTGVTKSTGIS